MPTPLDLHPRAIRSWLTPAEHAGAQTGPALDSSYGWLDSSLELQHGLDVLELTVDLVLPGLPAHSEQEASQ